MNNIYSKERIQSEDIKKMQNIAVNFLNTYPYTQKFKHLLIAIALCQGGANHYAVCEGKAKKYFDPNKNGLKDIDIWFFFEKNEKLYFHPVWKKNLDFGPSKFGKNPNDVNYTGRRIDFLGRSIKKGNQDAEKNILEWLQNGGGDSPKLLAQKVVVGLYPEKLCNKFIWVNPNLNT